METSIYNKELTIKPCSRDLTDPLKILWSCFIAFGILLICLRSADATTNSINSEKLNSTENISKEGSAQINDNNNIFKERYDPTRPKKSLRIDPLMEISSTVENLNKDLLNLNLIIISDQDKVANINQRSLREKDQIAELEIIKIENDKVLLQPIAINDLTRAQRLEQLITNNQFIRNHLVNGYIELKLPKGITNKSMIILKDKKTSDNNKKI